ncbi:MAG: glutamate synthase subunit beta [Deltaproteobacteria bacterium]|nr:glutamate synthase subunit beta [Deltaproteobacteria bacterium]
MGKITGFLEIPRETPAARPVEERLKDWCEFEGKLPIAKLQEQGARCMDCGVPFCHSGCPLGNHIPDWNDLVYRGKWREAFQRLQATNNFPEFTGRVCPAPCEEACVLNINNDPVAIKLIEKNIIDQAFSEGLVGPMGPTQRSGKRVAVIGSGPSGLACAQQLNRAGHLVTVFERADRPGGLLRYGIPDFKLQKSQLDRRLDLMTAEGVTFQVNTHVGSDTPLGALRRQFDAVVLTGGSTRPRDLPVPGRELQGIHFAMEFLEQQNRRVAGDSIDPLTSITATGKRVVVLGGGDTGSDCVGTANRQGAASVHQWELLARPPDRRTDEMPWPNYPMILRTSSSQEEGVERRYGVLTKTFSGEDGVVKKLHAIQVEWERKDSRPVMREVPGSEFELDVDLVLLAMGFLGPEQNGMIRELGVALDARGNVTTSGFMTSVPGVFAAGDMRRGQSLVVWAIWEGREAARAVDEYLMGKSLLMSTPAPLVG